MIILFVEGNYFIILLVLHVIIAGVLAGEG